MSRVKQKALLDSPSQELLEGGSDSARPFTSYTVASFPADTNLSVGYFDGVRPDVLSDLVRRSIIERHGDDFVLSDCTRSAVERYSEEGQLRLL
jgi:hypothetical protein